jgi:Tol biopolymer transport system component
MGEVYRARDSRLGRDVAVKVLPEELAQDRDRLGRFEQEARAASALNHPNIVTIHEIGFEGDLPFLAMELVDGKSLREIVVAGALPVRRVLAMGTQIAEGLAKAHAAGIVHRDLKPENVMVSKDGFVKILDFGLAKLAEPDSGGVSAMPTLARPETRPGVVMGTVGYMSPEQASGEALDYRSDQFSLGSMLYEMATGKKAFQKKTAAETMSAIIREEPEPAGKVRPDLPPPMRWILERCLAKEPEERYASTRDLARELAAVRDHISEVSGGIEAAAAPARSRRRAASLAAAVILLAAGAAAGWLVRPGRSARSAAPTFKRLTFREGGLHNARISPDGQTVFYGATWEGEPSRLYVTRIDSPESRALDFPVKTDILAISSMGVLAINLDQGPQGGILATVPLAGGVPRQILEKVPYASADWSPDGRELAVVRNVDGKFRLEFPIGRVVLEDPKVVPAHPRLSPSGDLIAFWDYESSSVKVIAPTGKAKKTLSPGWSRFAGVPCWTPDGKEIWFTASQPGEQDALWAVDRGGKQRLVARVPGSLELDDISRDGRVLIAHHTMVNSLRGMAPGASAERELSWLDASRPSDLSADGSRLLLTEQGEGSGRAPAVYLRGTDGSPAVRLGEGVGLALSPDGKRVLAKLEPGEGKPASLLLMPTGPGQVETLKTGSFESFGWGAFLPDGRRIVFSATGSNGLSRTHVLDPSGGAPRAIGPEGVSLFAFSSPLSPDGRFVLGRRASAEGPGLPVVIPLDGGEPRAIPDWKGGWPVQWTADGRALYVHVMPRREVVLVDVETGKTKLWRELSPVALGSPFPRRFRVTPDGKAYVYTTPRVFSALYLVEGLR